MSILSLGVLLTGPAGAAPLPQPEGEIDEVVAEESWKIPEGLTLRARVVTADPPEPANIGLRFGSEGLGGKRVAATLGTELPIGEWSPTIDLGVLARRGEIPRQWFLTLTGGKAGTLLPKTAPYEFKDAATNVTIEVEFQWQDKPLKTITQHGPAGGTIGVVVPAQLLTALRSPAAPEFVNGLMGLREYADQRLHRFAALQQGHVPKFTQYTVSTDINGYGTGSYFGIRYTDPHIVETEAQACQFLGVNGLRGLDAKFVNSLQQKMGGGFDVYLPERWIGFPVPQWNRSSKNNPEDGGCPFSSEVPQLTEERIKSALSFRADPFREVWLITRDEIGLCIDNTADGKAHPAKCSRCRAAFSDFLRTNGLTPADFGKTNWTEVVPLAVFDKTSQRPWLTDPQLGRQAYWSRRFNLYSTAKLFTPIRSALSQANAEKRSALAAGKTASPAARQPWLYSYALRAPNFLWRGHSLDLFEFYRHADNAFVYETSNRDRRVDVWDSYMCDVGRVVAADQGLALGVYVKPHRGSPVQRTLTAAARGAQHFQWYTYGPDYAMGDNFLGKEETIEATMRAANLLAKGEAALAGAQWAVPAEIAIVKPLSSEIWMHLSDSPPARVASFEDSKWVYSVLAHAHLPVDPLDEGLLETRDLSRYKVIYVTGPNITRKAVAKLADWVKAGGTLITSCGGLARDEANQPLLEMRALLGLKDRTEPEMWYKPEPYAGSQLDRLDDSSRLLAPVPDSAEIAGQFKPRYGREILQPADKAEVSARFTDGSAAVVRNPVGKGQVYVTGFFAGLEYAVPVMADTTKFNMLKDWNTFAGHWLTAPALQRVQPVVEPDSTMVEGVLVKQPGTGQRSIVLMNWGYQTAGHRTRGKQVSNIVKLVPQTNLVIHVRGAGAVKKATSLATGVDCRVQNSDSQTALTLPALLEGDIITLE